MSASVRGRGTSEGMAEIWWHRRETRRQAEKTNVSLKPREALTYSTIGAKPLTSRDYASVLFWHDSYLARDGEVFSLLGINSVFRKGHHYDGSNKEILETYSSSSGYCSSRRNRLGRLDVS